MMKVKEKELRQQGRGLKLRTRIMLIFITLVGIGFYFLVGFVLDNLRLRYLESVEEVLVDQTNILATILQSEMTDERIPVDNFRKAFEYVAGRTFSSQIYQFTKTDVDQMVYIADAKGIIIFDSNRGAEEGKDYSQWRDVAYTLRGQYGARATRLNPNDPNSSILYIAAPIYWKEKIVGVVTVSKPTRNINLFIESARPQILIAGAVVGLSVIFLGIALSMWVTQPIQRLTRYARAVRDGKSVKFPKLGGSEMGEMGSAFEEMREALEGKKYVEQYIQHLTHELKSPLSAISGAAEILEEEIPQEKRQQFVKNIQTESQRMRLIVERMLQLSSLEVRRGLHQVEEIDCQDILQRALSNLNLTIQEKEIQIKQEFGARCHFQGERFLIEQVLINVLQNAIEFSPVGGYVSIHASINEQDELELCIKDEGPGIPDYAIDRIFEKFYSLPRPSSGRKSSGLGLSFVYEVIRLHHGKIHVESLKPVGTQVTIRIPVYFSPTD
ncbi:MAG: two-component system sensor histidine kinase CreC [Deltaproteobacteria bacterium]|nr:two-component system sensor histidine kinase CreC [Deltaproteobacteria bacterium]